MDIFLSFSGALAQPIPVHPDANYRPQNRPVPPPSSNPSVVAAAPRAMANAPVVAAPLAAAGGAGGFSPWWILGPLLALLAAMALGALAYARKKKNDQLSDQDEKKDGNPADGKKDHPDRRHQVTQPTSNALPGID